MEPDFAAHLAARIVETRLCAAFGCYQWVDSPRLFCAGHWPRVPDNLRRALLNAWGRCDWDYAVLFTMCYLAVQEGMLTRGEARGKLRAAEAVLRRRYRVCDRED